jgi:CSLREA domain-containing protein
MKRFFVLLLTVLVIFAGYQESQSSTSAVITVNTDTEAVTDGLCSLREAITAANLNLPIDGCPSGAPGDIPADVIQFAEPAMVIHLLLDGSGEDNNQSGDLDILESVTIEGNGTAVHGYGDRVFDVGGNVVTFRDLWIAGGAGATYGGGIYVRKGAVQVTLDRVNLTNNEGLASGGGIYSNAYLLVRDSAIFDNSSLYAAGIFIESGVELVLENSTVAYNQAESEEAGGIWVYPGTQATFHNSTIADNSPNGIRVEIGAVAYLRNTIVINNTAQECFGGGILYISQGYNVLPANNECGILTATDQVAPGLLLGEFDYWSGPTMNYTLIPRSVAVDTGSCSGGDLMVDQRGVARPQGKGCDIGAHELLPSPYLLYLPNVRN